MGSPGCCFKSRARWHFCLDWVYCSLSQKRPQSFVSGFHFQWTENRALTGEGESLDPCGSSRGAHPRPHLVLGQPGLRRLCRHLGRVSEHLLPRASESGGPSNLPWSRSPTEHPEPGDAPLEGGQALGRPHICK